jgi:hypothetical protein
MGAVGMAEVQNYAPMFAPITGQNPLQDANQMMDLQTKGLQNQAALQEFKARQAIGPILQSAIDPQTGTLDANKAFVGMASHPDAAWKAQDFLKSATEMNLTNANIAKTHLETAMERQGQIAQSASSLLGSLKPGQELKERVCLHRDRLSQRIMSSLPNK